MALKAFLPVLLAGLVRFGTPASILNKHAAMAAAAVRGNSLEDARLQVCSTGWVIGSNGTCLCSKQPEISGAPAGTLSTENLDERSTIFLESLQRLFNISGSSLQSLLSQISAECVAHDKEMHDLYYEKERLDNDMTALSIPESLKLAVEEAKANLTQKQETSSMLRDKLQKLRFELTAATETYQKTKSNCTEQARLRDRIMRGLKALHGHVLGSKVHFPQAGALVEEKATTMFLLVFAIQAGTAPSSRLS